MVVDTSAVIAILLGEPESERFAACISAARHRRIAMASVVETTSVALARLRMNVFDVLRFLADGGIVPSALDERQMLLAGQALERFGRGRHPARLNLGDCFSYALAKSLNEPLLFKGDDFSRTDIEPALPP
jgi:ribonuclease VapC